MPKSLLVAAMLWTGVASAQSITIDTSAAGRHQTIDGFGTCVSGNDGQQPWYQQLYFDDLRASMLRMDITPQFTSTYSAHNYNCPWYSNDPPLPGPDGNNVRTYTGPTTYSETWDMRQAEIAVMGPDIDQNVMLFDYSGTATPGMLAAIGTAKASQLGDFKLFASMWSPAPWVKMTSGNTYSGSGTGMPSNGTPWPFIWGGNFAGGKLDVSGTPLSVFNDGTADTSALTQFARGIAAYVRGFQQTYGVHFYAISIQNELNFEEFYNSSTYPLSSEYIAALHAARVELAKYPDLADIKIMGPEDLLGSDAYSMWQYGGGATTVHKNLQYLENLAANDAGVDVDQFCIHGYASDGASAAGATPTSWQWWSGGWTTSPAAGVPANVPGFTSYGKKSWMTETSGEDITWLSPTTGFPNNGGWSIALKLHQALTAGEESGWAYWQLDDGSPVGTETLTDVDAGAGSPKYVAVKHFFHDIRPGAVRVDANVTGDANLLASAYVHDANGTLTVVLVNSDATATTASIALPSDPPGLGPFTAYTSQEQSLWQTSTIAPSAGLLSVPVPGYGVVTLVGNGTPVDAGSPRVDAGPVLDAGPREIADGGSERLADGGNSTELPDGGPDSKGLGAKTGCSCGNSDPVTLIGLGLFALSIARRRRS
jgi:O-glycosyl hydrolase